MSALSASSRSAFVGPEPTRSDLARTRARTNRRLLVNGLRIGVAVLLLGIWEIGTMKDATHPDGLWIDPFFYGRPSSIANQLWTWAQNGTAQGPSPQLVRDARRSAVKERVDPESIGVSRVFHRADLPDTEEQHGDPNSQSVDEQPTIRARSRASEIAARRLRADECATRRRA